MRKLQVNAKCLFRMASDGWLEIFDGYTSTGLAPDEVEALRKFLGEAPNSLSPTLQKGNES